MPKRFNCIQTPNVGDKDTNMVVTTFTAGIKYIHPLTARHWLLLATSDASRWILHLNELFAPTVDVFWWRRFTGETGTFSALRVKAGSAAGLGKGFQDMFNIYWIPYSAASVLFSRSFSRLRGTTDINSRCDVDQPFLLLLFLKQKF